jgi:hypothetical protein
MGTGGSEKALSGRYTAGMAIGHFISAFVNDAFLGLDNSRGVVPDAEISKNGFLLSVKGNY